MSILQREARESVTSIAGAVGLAPSAVLARIRKLRQAGVIRGYAARLDAAAVGFGLTAFVAVRTSEPLGRPASGLALAALPQVLEVHDVAGADCYLLKVAARDVNDLHRLLRERIAAVPHVRSTETTLVMHTLKDTTVLPLEPATRPDRGRRSGGTTPSTGRATGRTGSSRRGRRKGDNS